jgi:hypothetical protein
VLEQRAEEGPGGYSFLAEKATVEHGEARNYPYCSKIGFE